MPHISHHDKAIIQPLAVRLREIADLPVMAERRELWNRHNQLDRVRPMILIFAEGAWEELLPDSVLECEGEDAREIEWMLRHRIYWHENLPDDYVFEPKWTVKKAIEHTGWGLEPRQIESPDPRGAWRFDPVVKAPEDLKKLRFPEVRHDEAATQRRLEIAHQLFDGVLDVRLKGIDHMSFHLMAIYTKLRGLEEVMLDMYENPQMLHEAMAFLEEGHHRLIQQYVDLNLLSLNNDDSYHSSGGVGYTEELPPAGCDPDRVRPKDMWASAEAQELAQVSPEMHEEFSTQYERRLLTHFGLNGYGCCEDLTHKLDYVFQIPNIRRISISPFANVDRCAEQLEGKYIFSWKPRPTDIIGGFDSGRVREYLRHTLEVTRDCVIEMILKDTHTCQHEPRRFTQWAQLARELVDEFA